jgi:hypothetical protein
MKSNPKCEILLDQQSLHFGFDPRFMGFACLKTHV